MLFAIVSISNGYKILFLVPFSGPSHWILLQNFVKELINRGHEVTAIVNAPINNFKSPNYTEILINPPFDLSTICKCKKMIQQFCSDNIRLIRKHTDKIV